MTQQITLLASTTEREPTYYTARPLAPTAETVAFGNGRRTGIGMCT